MFGDLAWQTVAAIAAGLGVMGLILWVGLRNRSADAAPPDAQQPQPANAPKPNLVSRVVSWTSMVHRGGYRGQGQHPFLIETAARSNREPFVDR